MSKATPAVIRLLNEELEPVKDDETKQLKVVDDKCKPMLRALRTGAREAPSPERTPA